MAVTKSAARKAKVKTRSAAKSIKSSVKSAAKKKTKSTVSAAKKDLRGAQSAAGTIRGMDTDGIRNFTPSTISAATPLGEAIEVEQQALRNAPSGANIFDESIGGYGTALPGESGASAVERIKATKAKVKKKRK